MGLEMQISHPKCFYIGVFFILTAKEQVDYEKPNGNPL